jgi:hypothetical protein
MPSAKDVTATMLFTGTPGRSPPTHEKDQREAPVNNGVSILEVTKKSNKQIIVGSGGGEKRSAFLSQ